jgi:hypothetical protein
LLAARDGVSVLSEFNLLGCTRVKKLRLQTLNMWKRREIASNQSHGLEYRISNTTKKYLIPQSLSNQPPRKRYPRMLQNLN